MKCANCQHDEDDHGWDLGDEDGLPCYGRMNTTETACPCQDFVEKLGANCGHGALKHCYGKYEGRACNEQVDGKKCACNLWTAPPAPTTEVAPSSATS